MAIAEEVKHMGETKSIKDHDHDLVHELSKRTDSVWRYDQFIANAEGHRELQDFWKKLKKQDQENVTELKKLVAKECEKGCF